MCPAGGKSTHLFPMRFTLWGPIGVGIVSCPAFVEQAPGGGASPWAGFNRVTKRELPKGVNRRIDFSELGNRRFQGPPCSRKIE